MQEQITDPPSGMLAVIACADIQGVGDYIVPLRDVNSTTLRKVIEYCQYHVDAEEKDQIGNPKKGEEEVRNWDQVYIQVDIDTLYTLILAASNLKITSLQDLCCQRIADMIRGRTKQEIRAMFNITDDFTPEEEEEVRRENQWAFD
ncbi:hypothetical protein BSKO_02488 [Bryopsis sp. KO-2023]|nr:hypothetical protein BSKO_02488 [Bryopsis sp. KO-2023]